MKIIDIMVSEGYGRYWCSTDKKWKQRQGPKQTRKTESTDQSVEEKWSDKYKRSIDCNNPKGFSQRAHCQGRSKNESVEEGQFRSQDVEEFKPGPDALDDLKSKYLPDWEMLDHRILQAMYVAADHRRAAEFVQFINDLSEKMDHFAEVTQDVAEVTVKTTTFDVKGLTILDFQLAMIIDQYAKRHDIEQERMGGNFGMHENFDDGKKPGRKGLAKRVGVDCKQPASKLRSIAAKSSGERQRMAHWCANMKSGKQK